jgi:DNA-binding SARP family transcriptional activator
VQRRDAPGVDAVWPYAKPRELVALLGCHPDGCSKDSIGLALWPDLSATQLRNNLHVTLHHARRALGDPSWIVHVGGRYRIATELGVAVDVQRFRQASRRAREAATAEQRHAARAEALGWWGGDFCAGEQFGSWAEDERDRLRAVFLPLLLAHADETLAAGDAAGALETYQRALGEDPFWEAAFRGVVRSLLALGQRGEAQLRLQRFRERVAAEGGGALSAETMRLLAAGAVDA